MRILLEKNEKLKCIQESMSSVKDIEILEGNILEDDNLKYSILKAISSVNVCSGKDKLLFFIISALYNLLHAEFNKPC